MSESKKCLWKNLGIVAAAEGISALTTMGSRQLYGTLKKPPASPPGWLFPVVWTILYILMALSATMVCRSDSEYRKVALSTYWIQLLLNLLWPLVFFGMKKYGAAFFVLAALLVAVGNMIRYFGKVDKKAALYQIPYLLWTLYAGYLNFFIALENR